MPFQISSAMGVNDELKDRRDMYRLTLTGRECVYVHASHVRSAEGGVRVSIHLRHHLRWRARCRLYLGSSTS